MSTTIHELINKETNFWIKIIYIVYVYFQCYNFVGQKNNFHNFYLMDIALDIFYLHE